MLKICADCKKTKSNFYHNKSNKDGWDRLCKECRAQRSTSYEKRHASARRRMAVLHKKARQILLLTTPARENGDGGFGVVL